MNSVQFKSTSAPHQLKMQALIQSKPAETAVRFLLKNKEGSYKEGQVVVQCKFPNRSDAVLWKSHIDEHLAAAKRAARPSDLCINPEASLLEKTNSVLIVYQLDHINLFNDLDNRPIKIEEARDEALNLAGLTLDLNLRITQEIVNSKLTEESKDDQ